MPSHAKPRHAVPSLAGPRPASYKGIVIDPREGRKGIGTEMMEWPSEREIFGSCAVALAMVFGLGLLIGWLLHVVLGGG